MSTSDHLLTPTQSDPVTPFGVLVEMIEEIEGLLGGDEIADGRVQSNARVTLGFWRRKRCLGPRFSERGLSSSK